MITKFEKFEYYDDITKECHKRIIEIMRPSGYIIHYHSNIYKTTIENKKDLISTTYDSYESKYGDVVFHDTYSFFKNNFDPINYGNEYFLYPINHIQKLKDGEVLNYKKLPFFDDLFEVLDYYNKQKTIEKFKI